MYYVYYDDEILHVPFSEDAVYDAKLSCEVNSSAYFDFTISSEHSMVNELQERSGIVTVYADADLIFEGYITDYSDNIEGERSVSCASVLSYLNDTVVRPYSTKSGVYDLTAPKTPEDFFEWLITQHNNNVMGNKTFLIGDNDLDQLMDDESDGTFSRESDKVQTTAKEITDQLIDKLGGYLTLSYDWRGRRLVNYYATTPGINSQIIDFGENITDFSRKVDTDGQYTAVRPVGAKPDDSDVGITIESLTDEDIDEDIVKEGDVVYSRNAVETYGYCEYAYEDNDIETKSALRSAAIAQLRQLLNPTTSVEVKAVDLSLYMDGYTHLLPGQLVRVRALPFNIDEYMLVNSIDIDINDPENTTFALGIAYDTLTGQQSEAVGALNAAIDTQADAVSSLGDDVKAAADAAAKAAEDAEAAYALAQQIDLTGTHIHIKYSKYEDGLIPGLGTWKQAKEAVGIWAEAGHYTWAQVGVSMSDIPTSETEYIGILTDENEEAPSDPQKYAWALIKGEDGIQGKDGADGTSSYLHIKYSDYPNGYDDQGNPAIKETAGAYIGTYVNQNATDPEDPSVYTWVRIEGVDGADGTSVTILGSYDSLEDLEAAHPTGNKGDGYLVDGDLYVWNGLAWEDVGTIQGPSGETTYLHIAYANSSDGSVDFSLSDTEEREYMGTYTDFYEFDSTDPSRYTWVKIKGEDGEDGVGILAITVYYLASSKSDGVKNTDDGFTTDMQALSHTLKYLWSYQRIAYTNSLVELTDAVIIGVYGDTGDTGAAGKDGEDAKTIYVYCSNAPEEQYKNALLVDSDGNTVETGGIELEVGTTVSVTFKYGNTVSEPYLNVMLSGSKPIMTNGALFAYWTEGATIMFTYDGTYWQVASTPVYANTVTIGNSESQHIYIDSDSVDIVDDKTTLASFTGSGVEFYDGQSVDEDQSGNMLAKFSGDGVEFFNSAGTSIGTFGTYTIGNTDFTEMSASRRSVLVSSINQDSSYNEMATLQLTSDASNNGYQAVMGLGTENEATGYFSVHSDESPRTNSWLEMFCMGDVVTTTSSGSFQEKLSSSGLNLNALSSSAAPRIRAYNSGGDSICLRVLASSNSSPYSGLYSDSEGSWLIKTSTANSKYTVLTGNRILVRPASAFSTSSTGVMFYIQSNASDSVSASDSSSNSLFAAGVNSSGGYVRSYVTYNYTSDSSANMHVTSSGTFARSTSSSARYKNNINYLCNAENASEDGKAKAAIQSLDIGTKPTDPELHYRDRDEADAEMHSILDIPVVQFHFNEGYISDPDYDYTQWVTGFIVEDLVEVAPDLVEYQEKADEDGTDHMTDVPESWNIDKLVPKMLYIIQEQADQIADLQERVAELEAAHAG